MPCVPNVNSTQLHATDEWVILYVFAWMFFILAYVHKLVNATLRQRGVWYEVVGAMYAPTDQTVAATDDTDDGGGGGGGQCDADDTETT